MIGLGGGGLPNFLHQHIPQVNLSIQELFSEVILLVHIISDPLSSTLYRICYLFNSTLPFEKICKKSRKTIVYYILLLIINLHWKYSSFFFAVTDVDGDRQRGHWPGDRRGGQKVVWIPGGPTTESSCDWRNQVCSGCHQTRF